MPLQTIRLTPGVNVEQTPILNAAGWSASDKIRFWYGLPQKLGGWTHMNQTPLTGTARGSHAWADLAGNPYFAAGTEQRLELFAFGSVYDITPLMATHNVAVAFTTTAGSPIVKITDISFGGSVGDWVAIPVPVAIDGLIIQGFYQIQTVVNGSNYTITAARNAIAGVTAGGAVPDFTTTSTSANVEVTLAAHGLTTSSMFGVQVATTVGGIAIPVGSFAVLASPAPTANTFYITPAGTASSSTSGYENGGNVRLEYLTPTGQATSIAQSGYGSGLYGSGYYGQSSSNSPSYTTIRLWFLDNWGQDLIGNYTGSPIYVWTPPLSVTPSLPQGNVALAINSTNYPGEADAPVQVNASFVAIPQQIMIALGVDPVGGGTQDPMLVRWSDVADFTDWAPTTSNQAGSFRLPTGSQIVGGVRGTQFNYIWTDEGMWLMQYIGYPLVWSITKVSGGCELLAPHAAIFYNSTAYWPSTENFFIFDGNSVQVLPCTVWSQFFQNFNVQQKAKVWGWLDSTFNEIWWFYPSMNATEVDSYVKYQTVDRVWDFGELPRTTGVDTNPLGYPISIDETGLLQQHETSPDADGQPLLASITSGWFQLSEGSYFTMIERLIGDFVFSGGTVPSNTLQLTVQVRDYPTDPITTYGPYNWSPEGPPYSIVRARGRMANITISSASLGTFWRMGGVRFLMQPAGRR